MTTNILINLIITLTTNWQYAGESRTLLWPAEANRTTYYEIGTVTSNLVGNFDWRGRAVAVQLDSVPILSLRRSYVTKTVQEYSGISAEPIIPFWNETNAINVADLLRTLTNGNIIVTTNTTVKP